MATPPWDGIRGRTPKSTPLLIYVLPCPIWSFFFKKCSHILRILKTRQLFVPLGQAIADPKNKPPLRTCYAKFGSSESKGVCINLKNSKIWEYQGLPPWSGGCGWPPTNTTHSHKNYPAECCCSRSKGTSVIKYIRLKFDPSCPVFQGRSKSSKQTTGSITQQKRW